MSFAVRVGCDHIRQRAKAKLSDIENKIRNRQKMRRSLGRILTQCKVKNSTEDCPLVHQTKRKTTQSLSAEGMT